MSEFNHMSDDYLKEKVFLLRPIDYEYELSKMQPKDTFASFIGNKGDGPAFLLKHKDSQGLYLDSVIAVFPGLKDYPHLKDFEKKLDEFISSPWSGGRLGELESRYIMDSILPDDENANMIKELEKDMVSHLAYFRNRECHEYDDEMRLNNAFDNYKQASLDFDYGSASGDKVVSGFRPLVVPAYLYSEDFGTRWVADYKVKDVLAMKPVRDLEHFSNAGQGVEYMVGKIMKDFEKYGLSNKERIACWDEFVASLHPVAPKPFVPKYEFTASDRWGNEVKVSCELGRERVLMLEKEHETVHKHEPDDGAGIPMEVCYPERKHHKGNSLGR